MVQYLRPTESKPRLGRGLAALLHEVTTEADQGSYSKTLVKIPIELLRSNKFNPRRIFNEAELEALAASIKTRGILQPILVRPSDNEERTYDIIAGERRWRAAQRCCLLDVPAIVLLLSDRESLEIALIENIQRSDLNALEEANGYTLLIAEHGYTQEEVSQIIGKSRSHVANTIRLLALPEYTKSLVATGAISAGHARALLTLENPDKIADKILSAGLNVREVERLASLERPSRTANLSRNNSDPDMKLWLKALREALGTRVVLQLRGSHGELTISFRDLDHLDDICRKLVSSTPMNRNEWPPIAANSVDKT